MGIKIDWNSVEDAEAQEFSPIPEGEYVVTIESVTEKETKKGDDMWSLKLNIEEGDFKGRKVFTNLVFNEKGLSNVKKLYSCIFGTKLPKTCEPSDVEGEKVVVDVVITEYEGKKQNNIPFAGFKPCETERVPF